MQGWRPASMIRLRPSTTGVTPLKPNNALWENGDFTRIATTMRETGEALVNSLGITKGLKVLDLGFGDGRVRAAVFQKGGRRKSRDEVACTH